MTTGTEDSEAHDVAPLDPVAAAALDELQFLCRQKMEGLRSGDFVRSDLARIDKRMAAYADALVVRGPAVMEWLSTKLSAAESAADACGVAVALLESREPRAAQAVLPALTKSEQEPPVTGPETALPRRPSRRLGRSWSRATGAGSRFCNCAMTSTQYG